MSIQSERIKNEMTRNSLTLIEVEQRTGIKKSSLQRYMSGETNKIPLSAIEKLASLFGVTGAYLMGWDDNAIFSEIAVRMRIDTEFGSLVKKLDLLNGEQLASVKQIVDVLLKSV